MPFKLTLIYEIKALNITSSRSSIATVIGLKCIKKIEKDAFGCSKVNLSKTQENYYASYYH